MRQKVPTKPWCPPLLCVKIFDKRIFLKHQIVFQWNILVQWDKNLEGKSWYSPPYPNFFDTRSIATVKDSPTQIFGTVRQKIFDGKSWHSSPPLLFKLFRYPKSVKHEMVRSPTKFFGTVRQKIFRRKILILPPSPSYPNFFDTRNQWNTKGSPPLQNFSALWDKKFFTENVETPPPPPPPLIHKLFRYRKFSETHYRRVHLPNFSALWDKKISTKNRKSWHNPWSIKIFDTRN